MLFSNCRLDWDGCCSNRSSGHSELGVANSRGVALSELGLGVALSELGLGGAREGQKGCKGGKMQQAGWQEQLA